MAQWAKNPLAIQETQEMWVGSLGLEDPLKEEMATNSIILVWKILWTEQSGGLQSMGLQRVQHDWAHGIHIKCDIFENAKNYTLENI